MNYWPAETTNLAECHEPLLRMVTELADTGARTARVHYGARGWVCHHNTDLWRARRRPSTGRCGDSGRRAARGCARICGTTTSSPATATFLRARLAGDEGRGAVLPGCAGRGAEAQMAGHLPVALAGEPAPGGVAICAGPTMDNQILRDLFGHVHRGGRDPGM